MKADLTYRARLRRRRIRRRRKIILTVAFTGALLFSSVMVITIAASPKDAAVNAQEPACAALAAPVDIVSLTVENEAQKAENAQERSTDAAETEERCESAAQPTAVSLDYSTDEAYMMAKMAMAEAESEDTEGKALVILVILNRVWSDSFPETIEAVITQPNAFTSYANGRYDAVEPDEDCYAALELIEVEHWDGSCGALYFERTPEDGESTWHSENLERLFTHGAHTFYREAE